jgi:hypothetical protein
VVKVALVAAAPAVALAVEETGPDGGAVVTTGAGVTPGMLGVLPPPPPPQAQSNVQKTKSHARR